MRVVIALGANLGDRLQTLREAVHELRAHIAIEAVSSVYETDPVGGPDQPMYLNAVVIGETALSAHETLDFLQRIEQDHGRTREVRWGARSLDLDILDADGLILAVPDLELPHPRAHERAFVMVPWDEVDPQALIAGHGTVRDLLPLAQDGAGVRFHAAPDVLTVEA
jgi:2-amino-4-hydroxy-6-hydroxymethyldihydropteridine diphosphokinase